jgi:flagellin-like protein
MVQSRRATQRGQASLIGLLITLAIIMILAAVYYPQIAADHSEPGQGATPRERAYGAACSEYESQLNQAVFMYKNDHDDHPPRSLEELKAYGVTDDQIHAQGCYFQIDPASGHVSDVGQGKYVPVNPPASAIYKGRATGFHPDQPSQAPPAPAPSYTPIPPPSAAPSDPAAPGGGGGSTIGPGGVRIPNSQPVDPSAGDPGQDQ